MGIENILKSRGQMHHPGYNSNMNCSPADMYEIFVNLEMEHHITDSDMDEWIDQLEDKINRSDFFPAKDSALYELKRLYNVSKLKKVKKSIDRIENTDPIIKNFQRNTNTGKTFGYWGLVLDDYDAFNDEKNKLFWKRARYIAGIIAGSTLVYMLFDSIGH